MADYPLKGFKYGSDTYTIAEAMPYIIKCSSNKVFTKLGDDASNVYLNDAKVYAPDGVTEITDSTMIRNKSSFCIIEYKNTATNVVSTVVGSFIQPWPSTGDYGLVFRYDIPQTDEYLLFEMYMPSLGGGASKVSKYRYSYDLKINTNLDTLLANIDAAAPNTYTATITNAQKLYNIGGNNSAINSFDNNVSNIKNLWPSAYKLNILLDDGTNNKAKLEIISRWFDGTNYRLICIAHDSNGQLYTIGGIMHIRANLVYDEILFYKVA